MEIIWKSDCTEYEAGWGQRPDGIVVCDDIDVLKVKRKSLEGGSRELFWRYSEPKEVYCTNKTFKELKKRMVDDKNGVVHLGNGHTFDFYVKI